MNFSHEFWFTVGMYLIGGLVFVAINGFKIGQLEAKLATKAELAEKEKTRNAMIDRVYERFDEHKRESEAAYVRRDMCGQLHSNAKDEVKRIDEEYKNFRHEIRNQYQQLLDKYEMLYDKINELGNLIQKK